MGVVQIIANRPRAGKTCLVGALLTRLREQRRRVGYYRPFSATPEDDPDVRFISQRLLAESDAPQVPRARSLPQATSSGQLLNDQLIQEVREAVSSLESASDTVLVEGVDLGAPDGPGSTLAAQLAPLLGGRVLLAVQYAKDLDADAIISLAAPLGDRLAGVVVNSFPTYRRREIQEELPRALESSGVTMLGAIPDDRFMLAVTVQQIADHLGGRWVQGPVKTDACVDQFLIGGNIMDSGPNYFGRFPNQAVITRAERPDIQMASLMSDTRCLVLTGGAQPIEYIRVEAQQREVPLILVDGDTISTANALNGLLERANAYSVEKVRRFTELVEENLDLSALDSLLSADY